MPTPNAPLPPPKKQVRVKPKRRERRCLRCKRIFVYRRVERIYCSTYCRVMAWQAKKAREREATKRNAWKR